MTRRITLAAALAAIVASGTAVSAQPPAPEPSAAPPRPSAPQQPETPSPPPPLPSGPLQPSLVVPPGSDESAVLSVAVTISRYRGDELVRSLPYVLAVTAGPDDSFRPNRWPPSHVQINTEVPVRTRWQPADPDGAPTPDPPGGPLTYRFVGTQIECRATIAGDDRYRVTVIIEESSVYGEDATALEAAAVPGAPVFRSFESDNSLLLRDGQTSRYTAATDPVTGESIRVDVALTVLE